MDVKNNDIKKQMQRLWKATFGDSDEYISLVFDTYFDSALVEYELRSGVVIASLLAIPYEFILSIPVITAKGDRAVRSVALKALYLCGLATDPKYRGQGIMSKLMAQLDARCKESQYTFQFLIPANDELRNYYAKRGYSNNSPRSIFDGSLQKYIHNLLSESEFSSGNSQLKTENYGLDFLLRYNSIKLNNLPLDIINKLINDYILSISSQNIGSSEYGRLDLSRSDNGEDISINIEHNFIDWMTIIKENSISGGELYMIFSNDYNSNTDIVISDNNRNNNVLYQYRNTTDYVNQNTKNNVIIRRISEDNLSFDCGNSVVTTVMDTPDKINPNCKLYDKIKFGRAIAMFSIVENNNKKYDIRIFSNSVDKEEIISYCIYLSLMAHKKVSSISYTKIATNSNMNYEMQSTKRDLLCSVKDYTLNLRTEKSLEGECRDTLSYLPNKSNTISERIKKVIKTSESDDYLIMTRPVNLSEINKFLNTLTNDLKSGHLKEVASCSHQQFKNRITETKRKTGLPFSVNAYFLLE